MDQNNAKNGVNNAPPLIEDLIDELDASLNETLVEKFEGVQKTLKDVQDKQSMHWIVFLILICLIIVLQVVFYFFLRACIQSMNRLQLPDLSGFNLKM